MTSIITKNSRQEPMDFAVVLPTICNQSLLRAARSVFAQQPTTAIHLLIGIDVMRGDEGLLAKIRDECPPHMMLTMMDLGYSTSQRHGGVHPNHYSGALRSILSFAANSRYVATLDDNDWYAPMHLALLRQAIEGKAWAFSQRWLVDPETGWPICVDDWDSVGPGRGINAATFGGFMHPSTLMVDKLLCADMLHHWSQAAFADGGGEDRLVFEALRKRPYGESGYATCFCALNERSINDAHHVREFAARNIRWPQDRKLIVRHNALIERARDQLAQHMPKAAADTCFEALGVNPSSAVAIRLLAETAAALGNTEQALQYGQQADLLEFAMEPI